MFIIYIIIYYYIEVVLFIGVLNGVKSLVLLVGVIWDGIGIFWLCLSSVIYPFNTLLLEIICWDHPCYDDNITVKTLDI